MKPLPGTGWIQVAADDLSPASICSALEAGKFYASTGVELSLVRVRPTKLTINIEPQAGYSADSFTTEFIGHGGEVLKIETGYSPRFMISGDHKYVRAKVYGPTGNAWVQPYFLETSIVVDIDIIPGSATNTVDTNHHGGAGSGGLNDVIPVVIFGSSVANGDPEDFVANQIDPSTVGFGPAGGGYDPASPPQFNIDYNDDGTDDARFEFLTGDSGIACSDATATIAGETYIGEIFSGTESITTVCDASCHN
jgi:hypothetical protein